MLGPVWDTLDSLLIPPCCKVGTKTVCSPVGGSGDTVAYCQVECLVHGKLQELNQSSLLFPHPLPDPPTTARSTPLDPFIQHKRVL